MTWILPETERLLSPNRNTGRRAMRPDTLVLHYAVDHDNRPDGDSFIDDDSALGENFTPRERSHDCMDVARLFARESRRASAHLVIGRDGSKVQCVELADTAWHAGGGAFPDDGAGPVEPPQSGLMNRRSYGIEICNAGFAVDKLKVPAADRISAAHPARPRKVMEWETFPAVQIRTLEYAVSLIATAAFGGLKYVTGHEDVVNSHTRGQFKRGELVKPRYGGKVDPGPAFPWDAIDWASMGIRRIRYDFKQRAWVDHYAELERAA